MARLPGLLRRINLDLRIEHVSVPALLDLLRRDGIENPFLLDVGSGGRTVTPNTVHIDVARLANVAAVADACALPFRSETFDGVIVQGVLQLVCDPFECAREIHRVLKRSGCVYASEPFLHPDVMQDRFRFTVQGLRAVFSRFEAVRMGATRGPTVAFLRILESYLATLFSFNNWTLFRLLVYVFRVLLAPLKHLDRLLTRYDRIPRRVYTNSYFLGRKA